MCNTLYYAGMHTKFTYSQTVSNLADQNEHLNDSLLCLKDKRFSIIGFICHVNIQSLSETNWKIAGI